LLFVGAWAPPSPEAPPTPPRRFGGKKGVDFLVAGVGPRRPPPHWPPSGGTPPPPPLFWLVLFVLALGVAPKHRSANTTSSQEGKLFLFFEGVPEEFRKETEFSVPSSPPKDQKRPLARAPAPSVFPL